MEPDNGSNDDPERTDPAWSTYTPPVPNIYGPPQTSSPEVARLFGTKPSSKAGCVLIPFFVILLVAGGVIFGVIKGISEETGATEVFEASIYPEYSVLGVPAEPTGQRALSYFYNGELTEPSKGRSSYERFDLARIDPQVMLRLVQKAKRLVEDPTTWYVIIRKPGPPFDNGAWLSAYASNEFSESGYLQATLDGTIVNRYVSE